MNLSDLLKKPVEALTRDEAIYLAKFFYHHKLRLEGNPLEFFEPLPYQEGFQESELLEDWVVGGNRCGKTMNSAYKVVKQMVEVPNTKVWFATFASLSVSVQQNKVYKFLPKDKLDYCKYTVEGGFSNRVFSLWNGSIGRFKTYDQGESKFQADDVDVIWNDEEPPEKIYNEQSMRLVDRAGRMIVSMTPVNGITWVYDRIIKDTKSSHLRNIWFWDSFKNIHINQQALQNKINAYGEKEARARSKGEFLNLNSGRIYYAFDRDRNVKRLRLYPNIPLGLSFDFNVDPMTTSICQIIPGDPSRGEQDLILNILESVNTPDCNTRMQCEILREKLSSWSGELFIYGDASNQRRTESADVNDTNWTIIETYFPNATFKVPDFNPNIKERTSWVNAKLFSMQNKIGLYVNDIGCEKMINDLEQVIWGKDGKTKDKKNPQLNHNSDNLDYLIAEEFPLYLE